MADVKFSQFTPGGLMQVGDEPVGLRPSQPTLNYLFSFPGTGINDSNGLPLLGWNQAVGTAANYVSFTSATAGNPPTINAAGTDSNINLSLLPKGTGNLVLDNFNWPTSDGSNGWMLTTDGHKNLTFTASGSSGDVNPGLINQLTWYAASGNVVSGLPTANSAVMTTSSTGVPTWSSTMTNGQLIIGSTGATPTAATLTAGTGVTITNAAGGITIAAGGSVAITFNGDSGTATPSAGVITLNGGSTGLTTSASGSTVSLTGVLNLAHGGTNANLTASNGGIFYSTGTAGAILAGTATANQILQSGSNTTPAWSTATFAGTYAASTLLYSNGANTVTGLATANSASLVTTSAGVPVWSSTMTNGQVIIGSTGATPTAATLSAGTGVTITNSAGGITINAAGAGMTWTVETTNTSTAVNNGYISNSGSQLQFLLPVTAAVGSIIGIAGIGSGGWIVTQNASQLIHLGSSVTTTGTGGSLASTNQYDSMLLLCVVANTAWVVLGAPQSSGITVV